jgi:hypothetical protein
MQKVSHLYDIQAKPLLRIITILKGVRKEKFRIANGVSRKRNIHGVQSTHRLKC